MSDQHQDPLTLVYAGPNAVSAPAPKSFWKKLLAMMASRLGMTLLSGAIITFATNSPVILWGFRVVCSCIGFIGDEKVTKTVRGLVDKGGDVVHSVPADSDGSKKPIKQRIADTTGGVVKDAAGAATAPVTKAIGETQQKVGEGVQKVGDVADSVAKNIGGGVGNLKDDHRAKAEAAAAQKAARAEALQREKLFAKASALGLKGYADWPTERLRSEVMDAEAAKQKAYLEWWANHGFNGSCPGCHCPMRVSPHGHGRYGCPNFKCQLNSSAAQIRQQGALPPPRPYDPRFLLSWNNRNQVAHPQQKKGAGTQAAKRNPDAPAGEAKEALR